MTEADLIAASNLRRIYEEKHEALGVKTQAEVAAKMGWESNSIVSRYLNGRLPLSAQAIRRWSAFLQVKPTDIRSDYYSMPGAAFPLNEGPKPAEISEETIDYVVGIMADATDLANRWIEEGARVVTEKEREQLIMSAITQCLQTKNPPDIQMYDRLAKILRISG